VENLLNMGCVLKYERMNREKPEKEFFIEDLPLERQKKQIRNIVNLSGDRVDPEKLEAFSLECYTERGSIMKDIQNIIETVKKND